MPKTRKTAPDTTTFDLDAFIESRRELTRGVMFKRADDLAAEAADLQKALERLEENPDAERSIEEPGPEQIRILLAQLEERWEARATPVTVSEVTDRQMIRIRAGVLGGMTEAQREAMRKGGRADDVDPDDPTPMDLILLKQIETSLVSPRLSADDLWKIYSSSTTGEAAVNEIAAMVQEVSAVPDGPFSQGSSETPDTPASVPS